MVFEVVESTCDSPVRIFAAPKAIFKPGQIGELKEIDGRLVCDVSDGANPFGVIGDLKTEIFEHFDPANLVSVWPQRMVFRTDSYDIEQEYKEGNAIYVNSFGFMTSKKSHENAHIVARLISPSTAERPWMELLWI